MEENKYLVYHYCDLYAFLNIMRTKTLWLSDVKKSNDEDEGKYLLKSCMHILMYRELWIAVLIGDGFKRQNS